MARRLPGGQEAGSTTCQGRGELKRRATTLTITKVYFVRAGIVVASQPLPALPPTSSIGPRERAATATAAATAQRSNTVKQQREFCDTLRGGVEV